MADPLKRHKYAVNRILIPAARILSPEFNAAYLYFTGAHIELMRNLLDYANRETTFVDEYHEGYYISPSNEDLDLINIIVAELECMLMTIVLGYYDAYCCVRDVKAEETDAGSFVSGAWRTRDINDEHVDAKGIISIDSNQITLATGTYRCAIYAPAHRCHRNRIRLYNVSDTIEILLGLSNYSIDTSGGQHGAFLMGHFTLASPKVLEVQHQCSTTRNNDGLGRKAGFGDEIYTTAEFWRET